MSQEKTFKGKTLLIINSGNNKKKFIWDAISSLGLDIILVNNEKENAAYIKKVLIDNGSKELKE